MNLALTAKLKFDYGEHPSIFYESRSRFCFKFETIIFLKNFRKQLFFFSFLEVLLVLGGNCLKIFPTTFAYNYWSYRQSLTDDFVREQEAMPTVDIHLNIWRVKMEFQLLCSQIFQVT